MKFIQSRPIRTYVTGLERHHIIPKCVGGTDVRNNIIVLTPREHYLCHWMLAKFYGGKLWFAFNQMKRIIKGDIKKSSLYSLARKYVSEQIRSTNTGKIRDEKFCNDVSKRTKNTVVVKESETSNSYFRVSVFDDEYLNGNLMCYRVGFTHTENTKKKISENGTKGTQGYRNTLTGEKVYLKQKPTEQHFIEGILNDDEKDILRKRFTNNKFYTNKNTKEVIRLKDKDVPDGFIVGRPIEHMISGLNIMNDPNYRMIYNIKEKSNRYVHKDENLCEWDTLHSFGYCVIFDNFIFDSFDTFETLCCEFESRKKIKNNIKFKPHFNQTQERFDFCKKYEGLSYDDVGLYYMKISDISEDLTDKIFIRKEDGHKIDEFRRAFDEKARTRKESSGI